MNAPSPRTDPAALLLAPASAIAIGCVPFITVELYRHGFDAASATFWRAAFAFLVVGPVALLFRTPLTAAWRNGGRRIFGLALTLGAFQTYCYFRAIEALPTSVVILFFFVYPLVAMVLGRVLYGVRGSALGVTACLLILLGAGLTGSGTLEFGNARPVDFFFAVMPPLTYGLYAVLLARLSGSIPALANAAFLQLGSLLGFTLLVCVFGLRVPGDAANWARVAAAGILGSAFHVLALAYCLPRLGAAGYGVLSSLELVTVVLLGVFLLGEQLSPWQWLGIACVLAGMLVYRPAKR